MPRVRGKAKPWARRKAKFEKGLVIHLEDRCFAKPKDPYGFSSPSFRRASSSSKGVGTKMTSSANQGDVGTREGGSAIIKKS